MLFVKHKGIIPATFAKKPMIVKKWKAVAEIVKRVAAAQGEHADESVLRQPGGDQGHCR